MKNSNLHIINKVILEVNTNSKGKGYYLKDNIDVFIKKKLFPILENYFDSLENQNATYSIQIEKLEIDFLLDTNLDFEDLEKKIIENTIAQVKEYIENESPVSSNYTMVNNDKKNLEKIAHFIETGTNPWWNISDTIYDAEFVQELNDKAIDKNFSSKFLTIINSPTQRIRFIKQFSNEQIILIINKVFLQQIDNKREEIGVEVIHKIKTALEKKILHSLPSLSQRCLLWEITLLSLLDVSAYKREIKIKLFTLLYTILNYEVDEKRRELISLKISILIESKTSLEILSNLPAQVLELEKEVKKSFENDFVVDKKHSFKKEQKSSKFQKKQSKEENNIDSLNLEKTLNKSEILSETQSETESIISVDEYISHLKKIKKEDKLQINKEIVQEDEDANYYINNAGLILIHPFLKELLKNCDLLHTDNAIKNPDLAVHLLHYLATGLEQQYEHTMIFEKFLCNIPASEPIERNIILSDEIKEQANEMLSSVLNYWEIMKTSSIDLLQNEFLQRKGKLILDQGTQKIIVERKTQDILLDTIGWNISIIKLAWKPKIIYVEW